MEPTQILLGLFGAACMVVVIMIGRRHWAGAVALGLGIGAGTYALLSLYTSDPLKFVLDWIGTMI